MWRILDQQLCLTNKPFPLAAFSFPHVLTRGKSNYFMIFFSPTSSSNRSNYLPFPHGGTSYIAAQWAILAVTAQWASLAVAAQWAILAVRSTVVHSSYIAAQWSNCSCGSTVGVFLLCTVDNSSYSSAVVYSSCGSIVGYSSFSQAQWSILAILQHSGLLLL